MRIPRPVLLALCVAVTALAYYLVLFTNWTNHYLGASYTRLVMTEAVIVLAVFACYEVLRGDPQVQVRALAGAVGVPLFLVMLLLLWRGLQRFLLEWVAG